MKIKIKDLKVKDRIRKDLGDVEELAGSMSRLGQLQPIIIDKDNTLIAGGRRLGAAACLGWEEIDAILYENCDEIVHKDIELEENLRRKDLAWQEEVMAVKSLYELRNAKYGNQNLGLRGRPAYGEELYSMDNAASEMDRSKASISTDIALAKALLEMPIIAEEKSKAAAWKRYKREKETQICAAQARRTRVEDLAIQHTEAPPSTAEPQAGEPGTTRQDIKKVAWRGKGMLYHADSRDVLRVMQAETIDCIITDPPFGLGLFTEGQATSGARLAQSAGHMYDDDPYKIMEMLDFVMMHCARILKPRGHAYFFFHMTRYEEVYKMLRNHFGTCEETPLIWRKNTPGIGDPNAGYVYSYEPCFFVNRGRHMIKPQAFNVLLYDTIPAQQKIHPTEKPAALLRHLVQASCLPGEIILDPFAGSGSTLVAASQAGCRFIGIEREEQFHRAATNRIAEELGTLEAQQAKQEEIAAEV